MCGYDELTSSDPVVRRRHWTAVGIGAVVVLTVLGLVGTLVYRSTQTQENSVQPEKETVTTAL